MNSEYKAFLYKKLNEVSEKKEEFCTLNTQLMEENQKLKEQVEQLLTEKEGWEKSQVVEDVELDEEQLNEKSATDEYAHILAGQLKAKAKGDKAFMRNVVLALYDKFGRL